MVSICSGVLGDGGAGRAIDEAIPSLSILTLPFLGHFVRVDGEPRREEDGAAAAAVAGYTASNESMEMRLYICFIRYVVSI